MDIDIVLLGTVAPVILPRLIHNSDWDLVRRILDASTLPADTMNMIVPATDGDGDNALNVALFKRAPTDIIHKLITLGGLELIQEQNKEGQTSLHYACKYQAHVDIIRELIDIGGNDLICQVDNSQMTSLHYACANDASEQTVKLLIEKGGDELITAVEEDGWTALHFACRNNAENGVVKMLIDKGPDNFIFRSTDQGWTALHRACANDASVEVIELLVNKGKKRLLLQNTNDEPQRNALDYACMYHDDPAVIETLLSCGGDNLMESDRDKVTTSLFLLCASRGASSNMVLPFLLRGGKEMLVERRGNNMSVLHAACENADAKLDTIEVLLKFGGRRLLFAQDDNGDRAIHYAMKNGIDTGVIKLLLKKGGMDLAVSINRNRDNPLHNITSKTPLEAIDLIDRYSLGQLCFQRNNNGDIPLGILIPNVDVAEKHILHLQDIMYHYNKRYSVDSLVASAHSLIAAMRHLPQEKQYRLLRAKFIRTVLNHLAITPCAMLVMILDVAMQVVTVWIYAFNINHHGHSLPNNFVNGYNLSQSSQMYLYVSFGWITIREATQLYSSNFWGYIGDISNIIDVIQIGLVFFTFVTLYKDFAQETLLYLLICCIGVSWVRLIFVFSNIIFGVKVFLIALVSITRKLVPFLFVTVIIVLAFAHMYYATCPPPGIQCSSGSASTIEDAQYLDGAWTCELSDSYFKSFTMLFDGDFEFFDEWSGIQSTLSILFASVIGIVLLNILIAVVNDSFVKVSDDGENAFWPGRLHFLYEVDDISKVLCRFLHFSKQLNSEQKKVWYRYKPSRRMFSSYQNSIDIEEWHDFPSCYELLNWYYGISKKPAFYDRIYAFLQVAQWREIIPPSEGFSKVIVGVSHKEKIESHGLQLAIWMFSMVVLVVACALIPFMIVLAPLTLGVFWPMEIKEFVFFGPVTPKQVSLMKNDILDMEERLYQQMQHMEASLMQFKKALSEQRTIYSS